MDKKLERSLGVFLRMTLSFTSLMFSLSKLKVRSV
jgi:hypothetical protein